MTRIRISIFFLLISTLTFAGKPYTLKDLESDLLNKLCKCVDGNSNSSPEEVVFGAVEKCVRTIFNDYSKDPEMAKNFQSLIKAKNYDKNLSEYEQGRLFGKELISNIIEDFIKKCPTYRKSLIQFKNDYIKLLKNGSKTDDIQVVIKEFKSKKSKLESSPTNLAYYHCLLGILYEYAGNKKEAVKEYDESLKINPSMTQAKALKLLLK